MTARPLARALTAVLLSRWALPAVIVAYLVALAAIPVATASSEPAPVAATVAATQPVVLVHAGDTAHVAVTLSTAGAQPLDRAVTVRYQTGGALTVGSGAAARTLPSTATAGSDYTPASGDLTFPAGTASGTSQSFDVHTLGAGTPSQAKTINVALSSTDAATSASGQPPTVVIDAHGLPYLNAHLPIATRVADLMSRMTPAEKVGQMTQADRFMFTDASTTSNSSANDVRAWMPGSLLSGGGDTPTPNTPTGWADMVDSFESQALATPLQIPLIYGEDTVHGDGNMTGATVFPHNIGIGATRDPAIARAEGQVTADETRATGPQWGFAPCICVARDIRWGRTYESFGSEPSLVEKMETEIDGLQGTRPQAARSGRSSLSADDHILATVKHFAGDGGTRYGTGDSQYPIDQGVDVMDSGTFQKLFVAPYVPAVRQHHVGSVMPSYSSVQLDGAACPTKMSADRDLITGELKDRIGFGGLVISDYNAIDQIGNANTSCPIPSPLPAGVADADSYKLAVSANAGMDMFMAPSDYQKIETELTALVTNGVVPMSRVDDAVRRVLTQKFELGLFEHPFTDRSNIGEIGDTAHRAVAARAAAQSQVLLKNAHHVLPLSGSAHLYVAGSNADNLGAQTGGWTLTWQGQPGAVDDTGTTILRGIEAKDPHVTYSADATAPTAGSNVGVVVVGEHPYAEGQGDVGNTTGTTTNGGIESLNLTAADHQAVDTVCGAMPCVVLVVSGRPMTVGEQMGEIDGLVASWLPGSEGEGVADTLFGAVPFTGQLPQTWPRSLAQVPINVGDPGYDPQFPFGWGLRTSTARADLRAAARATGSVRLRSLAGAWWLWRRDGGPRDPVALLRRVRRAAGGLSRAPFARQEAVLAVARDVAQAQTVRSGGPDATSSPLLADADQALLTGDPERALALLTRAAA